MRVAILVPLALAAVVGPTAAASACSMDAVTGGTVSTLVTAVGNLLGITSGPPATVVQPAASSTTTNNSVTNNFITDGATGTTPASGTTPLTSTTAGGGLGKGGGGGGIGGLSGGSFGSTSPGGMPQNGSHDHVFAGGGAGAGAIFASGSTAVAETAGVGFVMASGGTDAAPLTTGVKLASLPGKSGSDDAVLVGMASLATDMLSPDSTPFSFGGPTPLSALPESANGWTMLAGLLGIGVAGAGWAWRSLII